MAGAAPAAGSEPSPTLTTAFLMVVPNACMWRAAQTGSAVNAVNAALRSPLGVYGLFCIPFVGLSLEKCFYDTAMSLQGISPNVQRDDRKEEGFPAGGHMLPSFSLVPVRRVSEYFS